MKSIRSKIMVSFSLLQVAVMATLILVVSGRMNTHMSRQAETLSQGLAELEGENLVGDLRVLESMLGELEREAARVNRVLTLNSRVAESVQSENSMGLSLILRAVAQPPEMDFSVVYDLEGRVLGSYPRKIDKVASSKLFQDWSLGKGVREGAARGAKGVPPSGFSYLSDEFLTAHGLEASSEGSGSLAVAAADVLRGNFNQPVGYVVTGKQLDGYDAPLVEFGIITGSSCVLYQGERPIAWAGFGASYDTPLTLEELRLDPAVFAAAVDKEDASRLRLQVREDPHYGAIEALRDFEGEVVGFLLTAAPEANFAAVREGVLSQAATATRQVGVWITLSGIIALLLFMLATSIIAQRAIAGPLGHVESTLQDIAEGKGDLTRTIPVRSADEVGRLAACFNVFVDRLRGMVGSARTVLVNVAEVSGAIRDASHEVAEGTTRQSEALDESRAAAEEISQSISGIVENTHVLAQSSGEGASSMAQMGAATVEIADQTERLFGEIENVSGTMTEMSHTTSHIMTQVTTLSASSEQTAASVVELASSIEQIRQNAEITSNLSEAAENDAREGATAVEESVRGIEALSEKMARYTDLAGDLAAHSEAIAQVVTVIREVSEQTGLLSLNAAIIAAQAGEHGRGFAVVADEIRSLAERTGDSTKEISSILDNLQRGTQEAITAMKEGQSSVHEEVARSRVAGEALAKILESSEKARQQSTAIAWATEEQARGSEQIATATDEVARTLSEIAVALQQHSSSTQQLDAATDSMAAIASHVKIATKEQAQTGSQIADTMDRIQAMSEEIDLATQDQQVRTQQVLEAVFAMRGLARASADRAVALDDVVKTLIRETDALQTEFGAFTV